MDKIYELSKWGTLKYLKIARAHLHFSYVLKASVSI